MEKKTEAAEKNKKMRKYNNNNNNTTTKVIMRWVQANEVDICIDCTISVRSYDLLCLWMRDT